MAQLYMTLRGQDFQPTPAEEKKLTTEAMGVLEEALNYTESNDIRMVLAGMYVDSKQYDKAVEHLEITSENAYDNYQMHVRIKDFYARMKRADMVAKEDQWLKENKDLLAQQQGQMMPQGGAMPVSPQ
jgi:predicted negative regulator of RcsB-dependent stress response